METTTAAGAVTQLFDEAVAKHRAGRLDEAGTLYDEILRIDPRHADALQLSGLIAYQCGDGALALQKIGQAIELNDNQPSYFCNYGNVLQAVGRLDDAERAFCRAIELQPEFANAHNNLGSLLKNRGLFERAITSYREAVRLSPDSAILHVNLAMAFHAAGLVEEQIQSLANAVHAEPDNPEWHNFLAETLARQHRMELAISHFRRAAQLAPNHAELHCNLGGALNEAGALEEAADELHRAIALNGDLSQAHYNLGIVFSRQGLLADALASFRKALDLEPAYAEAEINTGMVLWRMSDLTEAQAACERGLAINGDLAEGHVILGNVLKDLGAVDEAIGHYRRALALSPDDLVAHANLIFSLHYLTSTKPAEVAEEIAECNRRQTSAIRPMPRAGRRTKPNRRISIGYVSANLRTHPGGFFLGAVLAAHDRESFKVSCYVDAAEVDEHSRRIQSVVDHWQPIVAMTHEALAARVREDEIDILVDMNRFSGSCRLPAFARKPAPVQVTWMGGPITTTGLGAIDYIITDAVHTPPGHETGFIEEVIRVDNAYAIYQPPPYAPPVGPLAALANGHITFGCFNYLAKIQPEVIALWAEILAAVPESKLLIQSKAFAHETAGARIHEQFSRHAIDLSRIELKGGVNHRDLLALYDRIDVALDPFPYSGGITTCEALWMGVPVITMPGEVVPVRHSVSHMMNAGLSEWIAGRPESYMALAIDLASDPARLAEVRAGLRDRVSASRLCDAAGFTRQLETAYREMWRRSVSAG